jgi:hypothetical protein
MGEKGKLLKHQAKVTPVGRHAGDVLTGQKNAAFVRRFQPGNHPQQRRFTTTGRAK